MSDRQTWMFALAAFALLLVANHADYLLQAYQHGWATWLDLSARAPHWGTFDFIPHDPWHLVQWLYHLCLIVAPMLTVMWYEQTFRPDANMPYYWQKPWRAYAFKHRRVLVFVAAFALYAITRGVGFSLVRLLLNG